MPFNATLSFFRQILPSSGWYCLFSEKRHYWFDDLAPMAEHAVFLGETADVYVATAAFQLKRRLQANVSGKSCLYLDVDAGEGKPYADARTAYLAVEEWRDRAGLPRPLYVVSGGGLHVYWPLLAPLTRTVWQGAADRLKALCKEHGLAADPASTGDSARILRPPGTYNHKGGVRRPVYLGPQIPPYAAETLSVLFGSQVLAPATFVAGVSTGLSLEDKLANVYDVGDPLRAVAGCAQLSRFEAGDHLAEPEWYACLGVLVHIGEQGRQLAHQFSSNDPRYSAAATEAKLDHAKQAAGPTTCRRFRELAPAGCAGCPHDITSPILLGRVDSLPAAILAAKPDEMTLPAIADPWYWDRGRLAVREDGEGEAKETVILAEYAVYLAELQMAERSEGVSALIRTWEPSAKGWREFVVPLKEMISERGLSLFAHHGVVIRRKAWPSFLGFLTRAANDLRGRNAYGMRFEQFGWKPEGFVLAGSYLRPGVPAVPAYGSPEVTRRAKGMSVHGSAAAWSQACNALFARPGMEAHAFTVLCAFGAPLYALTGAQGVSFAHMRSRDSGLGKSTALEVAVSAFGTLDMFRIIKNDTAVAKFIFLGVSGHLPVLFDEIRDVDPETIKDFVLQATLGRDKNRGDQHGGLRNDALPWSTILLTASNNSLVDIVRANGNEEAQAARIFEYAVDKPPLFTKTEGDRLLDLCRANRGGAGRVYIQHLVDHRAEIAALVIAAMARIETEIGAGPEQRFVIRLLACVAVAGHLTRQLGLLTFDMTAILRWAVSVTKGAEEVRQLEKASDLPALLGGLFNDLWPHTLVMPGPHKPGPRDLKYTALQVPHGAIQARFEAESLLWEAHDQVVRAWMVKRNHAFADIERQLLALGVLKRKRPLKTLGRGHALSVGQVHVWEIDCRHALVAEIVEGVASNVLRMEKVG